MFPHRRQCARISNLQGAMQLRKAWHRSLSSSLQHIPWQAFSMELTSNCLCMNAAGEALFSVKLWGWTSSAYTVLEADLSGCICSS